MGREKCHEWQKSSSKRKGESLLEDSETSNVFWFGNRGTGQKIGSRTGVGRVKDVEILCGSDEDGQD